MNSFSSFIQTLSRKFGQTLSTSDETQTYSLQVDGEEIFLRYLPEDNEWLYFGFVTDFMRSAAPDQLEKALELNLFGRGTAGFHLGLIGKALALSGNLPLADAEPDRLVEQLLQLAQHLTPLHRILTGTEQNPHPDKDLNDSAPYLSELPVKPDAADTPRTDLSEDDPFSFLNTSFLQV